MLAWLRKIVFATERTLREVTLQYDDSATEIPGLQLGQDSARVLFRATLAIKAPSGFYLSS